MLERLLKIRNREGISPTIGIVLFLAIVVGLAGVLGFFVTNLGDEPKQISQAAVETNETNEEYEIQTLNEANTEEYGVEVNGQFISTVPAETGSSFKLTDITQVCEGDTVTVIGSSTSVSNVLLSDSVESNSNCEVNGTTTTSTATYDGSSWIVDTYLENTSAAQKYYIITLTNGQNQQVTETVTLQSGESTTIQATNSTYSENDNVSVGVLTPDQSTSEYSVQTSDTSGSDSVSGITGWTGGNQAGDYYYSPQNQVSVDESGSVNDSTTTNSDSQIATVDGDDPGVQLSTTRAQTGETINLYTVLTTTKDPSADETLVVSATETNTSSNVVSETTYTIQNGERKEAKESFSIGSTGQYVITVSLESSGEVYTAGTVNIIQTDIGISNATLDSPSDPSTGETLSFSADITNNTSDSKTATVDFFQNGSEFISKEITLSSGATKTVTGEYRPTNSRLYQFHVGVVESASIKKISEQYITTDSPVDVSASYTPSDPLVGEEVTFEATASHPDLNITEYRWEISDGTTATTTDSTFKHTFSSSDSYTYTVTAIAEDGETSSKDGGFVTPLDEDPASYPDWTNRIPITVSNPNASDFTSHQIKVTIPYESGMNSDFSDLRFGQEGNKLDYWIEKKINSSSATVWVEVDSLPANTDSTVYAYYNKDGVSSKSSGTDTFLLFDDFKRSSLGSEYNKYTESGSGQMYIENGDIAVVKPPQGSTSGVNSQLTYTDTKISKPYEFHSKHRERKDRTHKQALKSENETYVEGTYYRASHTRYSSRYTATGESAFVRNEGNSVSKTAAFDTRNWYNTSIDISDDHISIRASEYDGEASESHTFTGNSLPNEAYPFAAEAYSGFYDSSIGRTDWWFITKFDKQEPSTTVGSPEPN